MASTKANHIITNFPYTDINGADSLADVIIAENLNMILISPLNRENIYAIEEFNSIVKLANIVLKSFKITPSKAMFFVRTNQFSFKFIEDFIAHNLGEERIFQMIFNNVGTSEDSFIEFAELSHKEVSELYALLENEGANYYSPSINTCSSLCKDLTFHKNDNLFIETEDHIQCRKLRKEITPSRNLPGNFYKTYLQFRGDKIIPKIKSSHGININLKDYEDTNIFHIGFLTAVQAFQIMKKLNKAFPLILNDPLVYFWLKEKKCSSKTLNIDNKIKNQIKHAEEWLNQQENLPQIILYYY